MKEIVLVIVASVVSVAFSRVIDQCRSPIHAWNAHIAHLNRLHYHEAARQFAFNHPEFVSSDRWLNPTSDGE